MLVCVICVFAVSCRKDDGAPEDMKSSTVEGEPFVLYVPDSWIENYSSGISSAYYVSTQTIMVSARYETAVEKYREDSADDGAVLDAYMMACAEKYSDSVKNFNILTLDAAVLGGKDARHLKYTMDNDAGKSLTCRQITTIHGEDFVTLNFYCETDLYEANNAQFEKILSAFALRDKTVMNDNVTDKYTPEGMKRASEEEIEYRFYVPQSWICYSESGRSEAYYPESEKPNVTVTSYAQSVIATPEEYFAIAEEEYKKSISGYELLSTSEEFKVSGRKAISYTYKAIYDGVEFRIMQTVFAYNGAAYSITYTALADCFDDHLNDVNKMLEAFRLSWD